MLDIKYLREHHDDAEQRLCARGGSSYLAGIRELDEKRRSLLQANEALKAERNKVSDEIGKVKDKSLVQDKILRMRAVSQTIKEQDEELGRVDEELHSFLLTLPNLPHPATPAGTSEHDNVMVRTWGEARPLPFNAKPHWEIGEELGILDFERGAKITGARFTLYRKAAARLERALINFMLDLHTDTHGYEEVIPPFMVNRDSMTGTGQLPKFEEDLFRLVDPEFFMIPTAEVPVTNIHRGEILKKSDLPISYVAYT
ncbi:MAG TPA: serine--tRNA ligase, partial [Desulfuromonadales bacterium]|nr:serine--tRNA ligase [Desulfuromonadales bacterium]